MLVCQCVSVYVWHSDKYQLGILFSIHLFRSLNVSYNQGNAQCCFSASISPESWAGIDECANGVEIIANGYNSVLLDLHIFNFIPDPYEKACYLKWPLGRRCNPDFTFGYMSPKHLTYLFLCLTSYILLSSSVLGLGRPIEWISPVDSETCSQGEWGGEDLSE